MVDFISGGAVPAYSLAARFKALVTGEGVRVKVLSDDKVQIERDVSEDANFERLVAAGRMLNCEVLLGQYGVLTLERKPV